MGRFTMRFKVTLPTSPDGTDWGIYGDTPAEQWNGIQYEAEREDEDRSFTVCENCGEQQVPPKVDINCGARVCYGCDHHAGLVRCYCGWSAGGGDGNAELRAMGENVDFDY